MPPSLPVIRWTSAPPVYGCRWCGLPFAYHSPGASVRGRGFHHFASPTEAQRIARVRARVNEARAKK